MDFDKDTIAKGLILLVIAVLLVAFAHGVYVKMTPDPKADLVVAVNTPFPPFESVQNGQVVGFDITLANALGEKLNRNVVVKDFSDFSAIWPALDTEHADIAISGISITPERSVAFDFSVPYYTASQAVLAKKGKFPAAGNVTPPYFSGKKIGFQELTTSQSWVEKNLYTNVSLAANQSFKDWNIGLQSLRFGQVDVLIMDKPVAETFAREYSDLEVIGTIETHEQYGVVVKKGDPQKILPQINATIEELKTSGKYDQMIKDNFGGDS
jgi:polar amino acid transport system substrate-binding protein